MADSVAAPDALIELRQTLHAQPNIAPNDITNLIARDQEARWRRGDKVPLETYLDLHPALNDPALQLDLVYAEVMLREQSGDQPAAEEFCRRFPHLADSIRSLFQLHQALTAQPTLPPITQVMRPSELGSPAKSRTKHVASLVALPGFQIIEEIGRGGMGVVYKARQLELDRIVAVKMLRADSIDPEWELRLRREAETIAQVQHPHIVQVFEVGVHDDHPYLVLEFVPGGTLADRLRSGPLPPREAALLVQTIADAVHAAHERQIIHRDLKPGNILLQSEGAPSNGDSSTIRSSVNANGSSVIRKPTMNPKVTDFGLSKRLDQSQLSRTGELIGTPHYMAPEQASGGKTIGPAADVYALGAVLYECLTGRPPFIGESAVSVLMQVTKLEPVAPTRLRSGIPRDLESVCLKCLEKSPTRRFASALELADDLGRFLRGQPTMARPLSTVGKAVKLVRRYPLPFGLSALLLVSLLGGLVGVFWQWRAAVQARMDESHQRQAAEQNLYYARLVQAESLWINGETQRARALLQDCGPDPGRPDLRGWEWRRLQRMFRSEAQVIPLQHWVHGVYVQNSEPAQPMQFVFAEGRPRYTMMQPLMPGDGRAGWLTVGSQGQVDVRSGPDLPAGATALARHQGGHLLAWGTISGHVVVTDAHGQTVSTTQLPAGVTNMVFHPDGTKLYASIFNNQRCETCTIDVSTGGIQHQFLSGAGRPGALGIDPHGEWLAIGGENRCVRLYRLGDRTRIDEFTGLPEGVTTLQTSSDGQLLFAGTASGTIVAWNMGARTEAFRWSAHTGPIYALTMSQDGKLLASGGSDNAVRLWESRNGQAFAVFRGHESTVRCIDFSTDGRWLVSGGQDNTIRVWDTTLDARGRRIVFHPRLNDMALIDSPKGPLVRAVALIGRVQTFAITSGQNVGQFDQGIGLRPRYPVRYATFVGPNRDLVAISKTEPNVLQLWNGETGALLKSWPAAKGAITTIATDCHGRFLTWAAMTETGSAVYWWDAQTDRLSEPRHLNAAAIRALAISADGQFIAAIATPGSNQTEHTVWSLATTAQSPPKKLATGQSVSGAIAFRPDNHELAVVVDGEVRAFETRSWTPKYQFATERSTTCLAYSPDGQRLAMVGYSGNVMLADPSNGKCVFQLKGLAPGRPDDMACDARVAFSADGRWLVSTNWDGSINVWDGHPHLISDSQIVNPNRARN